MSDYDPSQPIPIESKRVPLEREVALQFQNFSGFIHQYSHNISMGGIFIKSVDPRPPGSLCRLEFRLADGYKLIEGRGEVIWIRRREESPERPAGMGIRFLELEPESQRLIRRMVEENVRTGGKPFDVDRVPRGAEEATPASPPPPDAPGGQTGGARDAAALATDDFELPDLDEETPALGRPEPATAALAASPAPPVAGQAPAAVTGGTASVGRRSGRRFVLVGLLVAAAAGAGGYLWVKRPDLPGLGGREVARRSGAKPELPAGVDRAAETPAPDRGSEPGGPDPAARPSGAEGAEPAVGGGAAAGGTAGDAGGGRAGSGTAGPTREPARAPAGGVGALERITWRREGARLVVELTTAGEVTTASFVSTRLEGSAEPRHLVRLLGIGQPFRSSILSVGEPELRRIRIGHHPGSGGGELHVVLDLGGPRMEVARAETAGRILRLYLAAAAG